MLTKIILALAVITTSPASMDYDLHSLTYNQVEGSGGVLAEITT